MTDLVVRRLLVDLQTPFPVRWCGGDAFRSAFFNALSLSFPVGEQFFIDSVRAGVKTLPPEEQARYAPEVQGFIGQEATHRRLHALFNAHLVAGGLQNQIEKRAARRIAAKADLGPRAHVAATAATEHFTALFADWTLRHPEIFEGAEPRLRTLWMWHASEEAEHRCTAFDVYRAMGGNHKWRVRIFLFVSWNFMTDVMRQTVRNLWADKALFRWSTWRSAWQVLMARDGLLRGNYAAWRDYMREDFHPSQQDIPLAAKWLQDNQAAYTVVGSGASHALGAPAAVQA